MIRRFFFLLLAFSLVGTAAAQTKVPAPAKKTVPRPAFDRALLDPAKLTEKAPDVFDVRMATTKGDVVIRVTRVWSPAGADRFYNLVKHGFYDGASFFRVMPGFVVQTGISAYPEVARAWARAGIQDDPVTQSNKRGSITFATGGPNTRTTQVFINLGDNARLDPMGFSPFGQVVEGMEVVEQLYGGYGDSVSRGGKGPEQDRIQTEGAAYLDREFPNLDKIVTAKIVMPATSTAPAKTPAKKTP
jgi:peptidyl-prolyl cis-trans isomerase A (cyclophilin A)